MKPFIIAHRGASALARHENSLEAFQIAINLGSDYAEFDIRKTRDGKLIVFHDPHYKGRPINLITYEELGQLSSKEGLRVPLFEEVIALCKGKIKLDIELKECGFEAEVINIVTKDFNYDEFMIKSFLDQCVTNIKKADPNIKSGLLLGVSNGSFKVRASEYFPMRRVKRCKADFVSPNKKLATRGFLLRMHLHKKDVYVWTVNAPSKIKKYLKRMLAGIITDRPDVALELRNELN